MVGTRVDFLARDVPCVFADSAEHRHVDPTTTGSGIPDDVENSSLQAVTSEGKAREDGPTMSSVVEGNERNGEKDDEKDEEEEEERDEEKTESKNARRLLSFL